MTHTPEQKAARRAIKGVGPNTDLAGNPLTEEQKATMRETEARWAREDAARATAADLLRDVPRSRFTIADVEWVRLSDVLAALSAAPVGVRVRELEWSLAEYNQREGSEESALSSFGRYYVKSGASYWGPGVIISHGYHSLSAAKAAAQQDYEARIMAALEPAPADEVRRKALMEARGKLHDLMCLPDGADLGIAKKWAAEARALIEKDNK